MRYLMLMVILSISALALADQPVISPRQQISAMTWLQGHWKGTFGDNPYETMYSSPEAGAILSWSKEFVPARPAYIEFERWGYDDTSAYVLPYPGGEPKIKFRLVNFDSTVTKAHFQNLSNDWPTDLIYHRISPDSLHITVSGPGKEGKTDAVMLRLGLVK